MGTLIFYGIVAAALAVGFGAWHHSIVVDGEKIGVAKQFEADKPILDLCAKYGNTDGATCAAFVAHMIEQEAQRETELATCTTAATHQNSAIDRIAALTAGALKDAQAAKARQAATQKDFDARQAQLSALASQHQTTALECKDELARVNSVLDGYRSGRVH
jgi:hypothetical protein